MTLVLLNLDRADFEATHKAGRRGDKEAARELDTLWRDYADTPLDCFTCGKPSKWPPHSMILPERDSATKLILAPLCADCAALPQQLRLHRCLQILRTMWSRSGKQCHFTMMPRHAR